MRYIGKQKNYQQRSLATDCW